MLYTQPIEQVCKNTKIEQTIYHTSVEPCKCVLQIYKFYKNILPISTKLHTIIKSVQLNFTEKQFLLEVGGK